MKPTTKLLIATLVLCTILQYVQAGKSKSSKTTTKKGGIFSRGKKSSSKNSKTSDETPKESKELHSALEHIKVFCHNKEIMDRMHLLSDEKQVVRGPYGYKEIKSFGKDVETKLKLDPKKYNAIAKELNEAEKHVENDGELSEIVTEAANFYRSLHIIEEMTEENHRNGNMGWKNHIVNQCGMIIHYCENFSK